MIVHLFAVRLSCVCIQMSEGERGTHCHVLPVLHEVHVCLVHNDHLQGRQEVKVTSLVTRQRRQMKTLHTHLFVLVAHASTGNRGNQNPIKQCMMQLCLDLPTRMTCIIYSILVTGY